MSATPALHDDLEQRLDLTEDEARYAAAGRGHAVSHKAVKAWLLSKNTDSPIPRPEPGD